jgi:VRR-NUC domain
MTQDARARRRKSRREEWGTQTALAEMLPRYIDPRTAFWTSLENRPRSRLSGLLQKRRGVRSGLPDLMFISAPKVIFIEVKSRSGRASRAQRRTRHELLAVGCEWFMARSARAALTALHRSGVPFRRPWKVPELHPWEGPFSGAERRLPQHPEVAARQRAACQRWRERKRACALAPA